MNFQVTQGPVAKAQKVIIYGPEGIGKSTLAAQFPDPIFIDTEGSTSNMNVKRFQKPTSWEMIQQEIEYIKNSGVARTLVIDTIDWAEQLCIQFVCQSKGKKGIEDFGYGNGYVYLSEEFGRLLNKLQELVDVGINVTLTAHSQIKKFEQPDELGAFDRYELKLGNKKTVATTSSLVKEWADMVLFCNYKLNVITEDNGKKKAQGGQRVMYTTHHPAWDAKNRFGLPDEVPMDFKSIAQIFVNQKSIQKPAEQVKQQPVQKELPKENENNQDVPFDYSDQIPTGIPKNVADLMKIGSVSEKEIMDVIHQGGFMPADTPIENVPNDLWNYLATNWENTLNFLNTKIRNTQGGKINE